MHATGSPHSPAPRWFQWQLSTWFVLVALLGWAFAIRPPQIVVTELVPLAGGHSSANTLIYVNPHYFAPVFALVAFACWKEISVQRGFARPVFRRRARQIAKGLSLLAIVVAIGTGGAHLHYSSAIHPTTNAPPDLWARFMAMNCSAVFFMSFGFALGLLGALVLSAAEPQPAAVHQGDLQRGAIP